MLVFKGGRKSGKTTWAIAESARTKIPILVYSDSGKKVILASAERMGVTIPDPITIDDLLVRRVSSRKVIVEEGQKVLERLLGTEIHGLTITDDND